MNITRWSEKKLRLIRLLSQILTVVLIGLIPTIFVCINYGLFNNNDEAVALAIKIPGIALIFLLFVYIGVFRFVKKIVDSIKPITSKRIYFKAILNTLINSFLPILLLIILLCARDNFEVFFKTFKEIFICLIIGSVVEGIFVDIPTFILDYDDENLHDDFKAMRRSIRK